MLSRALAVLVLSVGAWAGCRCRSTPPAESSHTKPAIRLVLISGIAGAIEPCGCVKDMLGGVDHAAAYIENLDESSTLVLGAGPMLFPDPALHPDRKTQDQWKAEALLQSLSHMGMRAWAPGANDFAAGAGELTRLVRSDLTSQAQGVKGPLPLAVNLSNVESAERTQIYTVGDIRVGVAGVSQPRYKGGLPEGVELSADVPSVKAAAEELKRRGASLRILLAALPRGEALRLAELVPEFQIVLIGKPADQGEANDPITPPTTVGRTLVIEGPNHLQAFYVVDLFVKDGSFQFVDGQARERALAELDQRIAELQARVESARKNSAVSKADLSARQRDLDNLKREREARRKDRAVPEGSFFRTTLVEVREKLGADRKVTAKLANYYRRVNDHNRQAFADRLPPPVPEGQSGFVGAENCVSCHQAEYAFFSTTRHARAYLTLSREFKEFNLDCVGCHVTGYNEPGGSTVAHVDKLQNVQCEVCHGPGSRHVENPTEKALISKPAPTLCATKCHHVPHVKPDWNVAEAWPHILGPGHGLPAVGEGG